MIRLIHWWLLRRERKICEKNQLKLEWEQFDEEMLLNNEEFKEMMKHYKQQLQKVRKLYERRSGS